MVPIQLWAEMGTCYTLSCPETCWVLGDCVMGYGTSVSSIHSILFVIMFTLFTHPSPNSVPPRVSCVRTSLCFMFLFYFAFSFPLFYFPIPEPWPWYMPDCMGTGFPIDCHLVYLHWLEDENNQTVLFIKNCCLIAQQKPHKNTIKYSLQFPSIFIIFGL